MALVKANNPHLLAAKKNQGKPKVVLKRRYISDIVEVEEKPPPKPPKVHDTGVDEDVLSELSDAFELLYDPNYFGHLEFDEQLRKFKSRDLLDAKLYKTALKAFGNQRFVRERLAKDNGRKRVFVAQPLSELRGFDSFSDVARLPSIQQDSGSGREVSTESNSRGGPDAVDGADSAGKEMARYQGWLRQRQQQHVDLERMGDVERYLKGKGGQLSAMEKAALHRIEESKRPKQVEEKVEELAKPHERPKSAVTVKRPSPLALFIIDGELRKRKLRLSDLFTSMDKDKDWLLTREEFRKAMRQHRVPLPEPLLEDMIITLDQDNNNQLDYRELAQGLEQYRREKRTPEFLALLSEESDQFLLSRGGPEAEAEADSPNEGGWNQQQQQERGLQQREEGAATATGAATTSRESSAAVAESGKSSRLHPGEFDASQERYSVDNAEASTELRRRDKVALGYMRRGRRRQEEFRSMVKTFDREIDDHVTPSRLPEKPLAEAVDAFRQRQLREFMAIVDACKEKGVVFSERLYRRVFLYPADRSGRTIAKQGLRAPGQRHSPDEVPLSLLLPPADRASVTAAARAGKSRKTAAVAAAASDRFAAASASSSSAWRGVRAGSLANVGRGLPTRRDLLVDDDDAEQELPTGAAMIRPKVDCWLTFEEFQRLTEGLDYSKQARVRFQANRDAFWPGKLEGRVRRYLDDTVYGPNVFFQATQPAGGRTHPYLPRETWPVRDGHVTYGSIDPMLAHHVTGPRSLQKKVAF